MKLLSIRFSVTDGAEEGIIFKKLLVSDRLRYPGQILIHGSSRADVEMADLGVAHLALRQADSLAMRSQRCVRIRVPVSVEIRLLRLRDRIPLRISAKREAV